MKLLLLSLLFCLPHFMISQSKDRDYYLDMSKALGYAYGIELTNDLITKKFDDLSKEALIAQINFNQAHNSSIEWIEEEIAKKMNISKSEFKNNLLNQIKEKVDLNNFSYSEADEFLKTFSEYRIKGNHELYKGFVQILLRHDPIYNAIPAKEYIKGYRTKLHSNDHPKSKGLNISIEYPKSWIEQEGKRPNVFKLIKSYNGTCILTIVIKDVLTEMGDVSLTNEELQYFKSSEFATEMYNDVFNHSYGQEMINSMGLEDVKDFSFKKTKIDGQPTMLIKASGQMNQGIVNMPVYMINYLIIYKNYFVNIGSSINDLNGNLEEEKSKFEMLTDLIVSGLIFTDKW